MEKINNLREEIKSIAKKNDELISGNEGLNTLISRIDDLEVMQLKDIIKQDTIFETENIKLILDEMSKELEDLNIQEDLSCEDRIDTGYISSFLSDDNTIIHEITDIKDFLDLVLKEDTLNLYRGMDSIDYNLMPSAFRERYTKQEFDLDMSKFEKMIEHFDKNFSSKTLLEKHAYAQHYLFNTNLMDFTRSPLIAMLFALENFKSKSDAVIYEVNIQKYNEEVLNIQATDCINIKSTSRESLEERLLPTFIYSNDINDRIYTQKGVFLYYPFENADTQEGKEKIEKKFIENCIRMSVLKVYIIRKDYRNEILNNLIDLGMTFENIYPELESAAHTLKFKSYFNKIGG